MPFIFKEKNEDWAYDLSKDFGVKGEIFNSTVISQSIDSILTTIPGERLFNRNFGSTLFLHLFENVNAINGERILDEAIAAIKRWEDRILIDEVNCKMFIDNDNNSINITIPYVILRTGETNQYQKNFSV